MELFYIWQLYLSLFLTFFYQFCLLQDISARYKLHINLQFWEKCLRKNFFFHQRIKSKKGNCEFLSHSSDVFFSDLQVYKSQFLGYILQFLLFFLEMRGKGQRSCEIKSPDYLIYFFIPCQKRTSIHLLWRICKKTCCTSQHCFHLLQKIVFLPLSFHLMKSKP